MFNACSTTFAPSGTMYGGNSTSTFTGSGSGDFAANGAACVTGSIGVADVPSLR